MGARGNHQRQFILVWGTGSYKIVIADSPMMIATICFEKHNLASQAICPAPKSLDIQFATHHYSHLNKLRILFFLRFSSEFIFPLLELMNIEKSVLPLTVRDFFPVVRDKI